MKTNGKRKTPPLRETSRLMAARLLAAQRLAEKREGGLWSIEAGGGDRLKVKLDSLSYDPAPSLDAFALDRWFRLDRVGRQRKAVCYQLALGDMRFQIIVEPTGALAVELTHGGFGGKGAVDFTDVR